MTKYTRKLYEEILNKLDIPVGEMDDELEDEILDIIDDYIEFALYEQSVRLLKNNDT